MSDLDKSETVTLVVNTSPSVIHVRFGDIDNNGANSECGRRGLAAFEVTTMPSDSSCVQCTGGKITQSSLLAQNSLFRNRAERHLKKYFYRYEIVYLIIIVTLFAITRLPR